MILVWLGVALLSVSWLFGLGYYHGVDWTGWGITVSLGVAFLLTLPSPIAVRKAPAIPALLVGLPAVFVTPWPYRAAVLLLVAGLALRVLPILDARLKRVSTAAVTAGCLLLSQALAITFYSAATSRSHELPAPLAQMLGGIARLLGMDAAVYGNTIALHSMRKVHMLGATWENLLDPPSFCFSVAVLSLLFWIALTTVPSERIKPFLLRSLLTFAGIMAIWLPVRAGLLMALYVHDVLRTDFEAPLTAMRLFWNSWLHLLLLVGPALMCWKLLPHAPTEQDGGGTQTADPTRDGFRNRLVPLAVVAAGVAMITFGLYWDPVGARQQGRVIVEEYNPNPAVIWERTDKPYDTSWYGNRSGYNYYCICDYCTRFYSMSRLTGPMDDGALNQCDVLIIKVPTRPFSQPEIRSVRRFVERGGGLLLIGEHTDVFRTSEYLNPIARVFGFEFSSDCLFGIDSVFEQRYERPLMPHPIVQYLPPMHFATSCSIAPGTSSGRAAICDTGLKNLMADYHFNNYYPHPVDQAEMRYGSFVQLWATRYGKGRVVAFSDSTIFSNFCVFDPGKSELMIGMIEWLNHRSWLGNPRPWIVCGAVAVLLGGLAVALLGRADVPLLAASGLLGWAVAVVAVQSAHRVTMPEPKAERPLVRVAIDRTVCDAPLAKNGFVDPSGEGFGIFERWILRLGYFTARREGARVFDADLVVFFRPNRPVSTQFHDQMVEYVASGGKILVIDAPKDDTSTSNDLLDTLGITVGRSARISGMLQTAAWPVIPIQNAAVVSGGEPFAWVEGEPVGTTIRYGKGRVTVIGLGSRFNDASMGVTADTIPDENLRRVFDVQFGLLKAIVEDWP